MSPLKRASLAPGALRDLMDALHELHLASGLPSTRDLERDIGSRGATSHAAIHKIFAGSSRPAWERLRRLVEVMASRAGRDEESEVERFRTLWTQAARPRLDTRVEPDTTVSPPTEVQAETREALVSAETPRLFRYLSELIPDVLDELEAVGGRSAIGNFRIPTGFNDLDSLLGGWSQGYLIVIGGRPSSGKTTLLLDFCRAASIKYRLPAMAISGEMNSRDLQLRLLSAQSRVPAHTMRTGQMNDDDWARLARTMSAMADAPLCIGTRQDFRMEQLIADATRYVQKAGLKLLLIDGLQWMINDSEPSTGIPPASALRRLKALAESLRIPVIITAHCERLQERDGTLIGDPIGKLEYGSLVEQIADVVIILHRPDQDDREHPRAGEADLIVVKNRNGPTATITLAFQGHYCRFVDLVSDEYALFRVEAPAEAKATAHDRELYYRLMEQVPPDGKVIDWLKNGFMLKALPLRHVEAIAQLAKMMSLEAIGFDDNEARDRFNDLQTAVDNFNSEILQYTWADQGGNWMEIPNEWKDKDRERYSLALTAIANVRETFIAAYDNFRKTCHVKGIDSALTSWQ